MYKYADANGLMILRREDEAHLLFAEGSAIANKRASAPVSGEQGRAKVERSHG